jgi:hypothetical protein
MDKTTFKAKFASTGIYPCQVKDETFYVKSMTLAEKDSVEDSVTDKKTGQIQIRGLRSKLLVRCLCDESGKRLFEDTDIDELGTLSAEMLEPLVDLALRVNGFKPEQTEAAKKN